MMKVPVSRSKHSARNAGQEGGGGGQQTPVWAAGVRHFGGAQHITLHPGNVASQAQSPWVLCSIQTH